MRGRYLSLALLCATIKPYTAMSVTPSIQAARDQWTNRGSARPSFADLPKPGQESVWDYPRPPALRDDLRTIEVRSLETNELLARTTRAKKICETSHPPTFYIPPEDIIAPFTITSGSSSFCEWKGSAQYLLFEGKNIAWRYPQPFEGEMASLANYVAFYASKTKCTIDGEAVIPQGGGFYGGWITSDLAGPFKGDPGSSGW